MTEQDLSTSSTPPTTTSFGFSIPAAVANYEGDGGFTERELPWVKAAAELEDGNAKTIENVLAISRLLPEAALHTALESLALRRRRPGPPLRSEAGYFVATLKRMRDERQYAERSSQ